MLSTQEIDTYFQTLNEELETRPITKPLMHYFKALLKPSIFHCIYAIIEEKGREGKIMWAELQSIHDTYAQIVQGERPWTALGDFLNYWYTYAVDRRLELIREPLTLPDDVTPELRQWAAFCAASVDYLCERDHISCPDWVNDPSYFLATAWFMGLGANKPHVQARLLEETPEMFRRRNVFCSPHAFSTKYDVATEVRQR